MLRRSEIVEGTHVGGEMVHQIKENETSKARDLLRKSPTGFKRRGHGGAMSGESGNRMSVLPSRP